MTPIQAVNRDARDYNFSTWSEEEVEKFLNDLRDAITLCVTEACASDHEALKEENRCLRKDVEKLSPEAVAYNNLLGLFQAVLDKAEVGEGEKNVPVVEALLDKVSESRQLREEVERLETTIREQEEEIQGLRDTLKDLSDE